MGVDFRQREGRVTTSGVLTYPAPKWCGVVFLLAIPAAYAADEPRVNLVPEPPARAARADLRVDSDLVLVPVSVTDPKNRAVTGLRREAFRLYDEKTEQRVVHFAEEDAPISVGIVFDSSRSMTRKLKQARAAVAEFLRNSNPEDEFFLVNFNDRAQLAVPFTASAGDIPERLMETGAMGRTALVDAIYLALDTMKGAAHSRKALLVVSDGGDNDSRYSEGELRRRLRETTVAIYAMGIYERGLAILPEEERGGPKLLEDITGQSGGRHFPVYELADLPQAAAQIGLELRNQYVLGYTPGDRLNDGKYHKLQVKLVGQGNLHVTSRPGYFAPER
jgi:Ca-activated chloride channel homolog